jgi:hypothetical protein
VALLTRQVFLAENKETLKLGDFGLSKNLGAKTFTDTYVGVGVRLMPALAHIHPS